MAWLSGWLYRKSHIINHASGAGTDYQIRIKVHYGSGTDNGEDVYLNEHCRTDFGDVRFTKDDKVTELKYFLYEKVDSNYAIFWVKIPDNLDSIDRTIYIYYGRDVTTTSNGEDTFVMFDDFNNYSIGDSPNANDWETSGTGANDTIDVQQDPADSGKKCFRIKESDDNVYTILNALFGTNLKGYAIHFRFRTNNLECFFRSHDGSGSLVIAVYGDASYNLKWYDGGSYQEFSPAFDYSLNTWYEIEERTVDTGKSYMHWIIDGVDRSGGFYGAMTDGVNKYRFYPAKTRATNLYIGGVGQDKRYIFVRKFTNPEPSHGSWGSEEKLGAGGKPDIMSGGFMIAD